MAKKENKNTKTRLHPRNKNREAYDLEALKISTPEIEKFIITNKHGSETINFSNPVAVKLLNKAILKHYYGIEYWDFPNHNLCPPIPGRADYIHHMADLLASYNHGKIPTGEGITCYDIGVGANCIYPIIGVTEYGWNFIGSDIDEESLASAKKIVENNPQLNGKVEIAIQNNYDDTFYGVITKEEKIDLSICNPPFHASVEEAQESTQRKIKNLTGKTKNNIQRNFAGASNELIYEGGEYQFIKNIIRESIKFKKNVFWFSTMVSKKAHVKDIHTRLEKSQAKQIKAIPMGTGNKTTRIIAWTFLSQEEQENWAKTRWKKA